jgi:hypothetical protein
MDLQQDPLAPEQEYVSFQIFCLDDNKNSLVQDETELHAILQECLASTLDVCTAYVWQHDRFNLHVSPAGDCTGETYRLPL